jgi:hypothetical protein
LPRRGLTRIPRGAIDWAGIPLLVTGLGALVLGLMQGQSWGWGSLAVIALVFVRRLPAEPTGGARPIRGDR